MRPLSNFVLSVMLVFLFLSGCSRNSETDNPVAMIGLTETTLGRSLVERAADIANSWIEPETEIRFAPSWKAQNPKDVVRIYAISEFHAPSIYMVAVPT